MKKISDKEEKQRELKVLRHSVEKALRLSKHSEVTGVEVVAALEDGFSITVRRGKVETIEYHRDRGLGITLFDGHRYAAVSTSDTSTRSIEEAIQHARHSVQFLQEDPCIGLADANLMAKKMADLDLYHPWDISTEEAIEKAIHCEKCAMAYDPRIKNSEGVTIATHKNYYVYGNSHGFIGVHPTTYHVVSCCLIAEQKDSMERDFSMSISCDYRQLNTFDTIAKEASEKAVRRLGSRKLVSQKTPVIFEAEIARSLLSIFISAIHGHNLYQKMSFLVDHLGKPVFSKHISIHEDPFLPRSLGSATFDSEGVATRKQHFVKDGILTNYVLNSYTARKLGLQTTGNAGGVHNLFINHDDIDLRGLIKKMGKGLLLTELIGFGENLVTGDFSKGVAGFWVENGEVQYPVSEITIAGNLRDIFLNVVSVANDVNVKSTIKTGSILVDSMMIGGN